MILLVDNYDSFVHNLARYVRELGNEAVVVRNDALTVAAVERLAPTHIILSPGPCSPREAGISVDLVRQLGPVVPILGVCLGHQCIGAAYGGDIVRVGRPIHGRTSPITHDGTSVFTGLPSPLRVARYHSLVIAQSTMPDSLRVLATSDEDGEVMAVAHRDHPIVGVQFHPESAASQFGYAILDRFLRGDASSAAALPSRADGARDTEGTRPPWVIPGEEARAFIPPSVEHVR